MNMRIKIVENDTKLVTKVVLLNKDKEVLLLKRTEYVKKYAGEWDLPGGHIKPSETANPISGLKREVLEETNICITNASLYTKKENISFYWSILESSPKINLSSEHSEWKFFKINELDEEQKFQKIAAEIMRKMT